MISHFVRRLTLSLFHAVPQQFYELHCSQVQVFLGIFQQIATTLNWCIYCLTEIRIQEEIHVSQLKKKQSE
jgi:hypothetical protein